eukprot:3912238-Prymnesium_polylepis.1
MRATHTPSRAPSTGNGAPHAVRRPHTRSSASSAATHSDSSAAPKRCQWSSRSPPRAVTSAHSPELSLIHI